MKDSARSGRPAPPRLAVWLLRRISKGDTGYGAEGDLEELFNYQCGREGDSKARSLYWRHVLQMVPGSLNNLFYWSAVMFRNYMKIAFRNFSKQKSFSFINIAGLSIGMAAFILIFFWVRDEFSYDKSYPNAKNIYRLYRQFDTSDGRLTSTVCPAGTRAALKDRFPGVVDVVSFTRPRWVLSAEGKKFNQVIAVASPSIFDIFSLKFDRGSSENALSSLDNIVITRDLARKLFGSEDPIGKTIQVETWYKATVTGVIEGLPERTTVFPFDAVVNIDILKPLWGRDMTDMNIGNYQTYMLKDPNADADELQAAVADIFQPYFEKGSVEGGTSVKLLMHPLLRERLHDIGGGGLINYVYIFSAVGVLILLIACFNYMNLSTARTRKRATEVGIRRVVGAGRYQLGRQFFGEALIMSFLAALMAAALVSVTLPWFDTISGKHIDFSFDLTTALLFAGVTLLTGIVSGSYPAMVLSSLEPASTLKSGTFRGASGATFRKALVVTQFAISIFLVIGSLVIFRQLDYIRNKDLGFRTDNVVEFQLSSSIAKQYDAFRQTLLDHPGITGVTKTNAPPVYRESSTGGDNIDWEGKDPEDIVNDFGLMGTDEGFLEVFRPQVVAGRFFSSEFPSDMKSGAVINESALARMGLGDPIGKTLTTYGKTYTIIGVIKDFNLESLHHPIKPLALLPNWGVDGICVSISGDDRAEARAFIESTVKKFDPGANLVYSFIDDLRMNTYGTEIRTESIIRYGTILAIFISCLGLLGLAAYTTEERTKEIGIRKVLGASAARIIFLLTREFIKWVLIANIIAWPVAWFAARRWLEGFAYRTSLDIWIFASAGVAAMMIALVTVGWQALKAARTDPASSLKYE